MQLFTQDELCKLGAVWLRPDSTANLTHDKIIDYLADSQVVLCSSTDALWRPKEPSSGAKFEFIVPGVIGTLVAILGLMANLVALLRLMGDPWKTQLIHPILTVLVLWDSGLLVIGWMVLSLVPLVGYGGFVPGPGGTIANWYPYGQALLGVALTGIIWTTAGVTATRYALGLRRNRWFRAPYLWLGLIGISATMFRLPGLFELRSDQCCSLEAFSMVPEVCRKDYARQGTPYFFWYNRVGYAVFVVHGPILLQIILLGIMLFTLKKSNVNFFKRMLASKGSIASIKIAWGFSWYKSTNLRRYIRLDRILWVILLKFAAFYSGYTGINIAEHIMYHLRVSSHPATAYVADPVILSAMVHSATNGIIFLLFALPPSWRTSSSRRPNKVIHLSRMDRGPKTRVDLVVSKKEKKTELQSHRY